MGLTEPNMGLDDFKSDDSSDELDDDVKDTEGEIDKRSKNVEEKTEQGGLESFVTDVKDTDWTDELDREKANPWMDDFTAAQWNDMTTKEKVRYVRTNYYEDYRPEVEIEQEWSYRKVIEVECKCQNTFTFRSAGTCMHCGRGYTFTGTSVVMKYDPHD